MTCKIERVLAPVGVVVHRVSGRMVGASVHVLQELIENEKTLNRKLALDLTEVTVVSLEAIKTLRVAEANGIELRNCPGYIREWISRLGSMWIWKWTMIHQKQTTYSAFGCPQLKGYAHNRNEKHPRLSSSF
jgi:hypothetical protein